MATAPTETRKPVSKEQAQFREEALELIEVRIPKSWVRLISTVQNNCRYGVLDVTLVNAEPTHGTVKPDIRFDKPLTGQVTVDLDFDLTTAGNIAPKKNK